MAKKVKTSHPITATKAAAKREAAKKTLPAKTAAKKTAPAETHQARHQIPDYLQSTQRVIEEASPHNTKHIFAQKGINAFLLIVDQLAKQESSQKQLIICPDDIYCYQLQEELAKISQTHAQNSEIISTSKPSQNKSIKFYDLKSLNLEENSTSEQLEKAVNKYIKEQKLEGLSHIYIYQAENLTTKLASDFYKLLERKLKEQNPELQVFAITNSDVIHAHKTDSSNPNSINSTSLFGASRNAPRFEALNSQLIQRNKSIRKFTYTPLHSLGALDKSKSAIRNSCYDEDALNALKTSIKEKLKQGKSKILIRAASRKQVSQITNALSKEGLNVGSFDSSQGIKASKSYNVKSEYDYDNPYKLLSAWGQGDNKAFEVLVHCQKFDGMEIAADVLYLLDITESDHELAQMLSPIFIISEEEAGEKEILYLNGTNNNSLEARIKKIQESSLRHIVNRQARNGSHETNPENLASENLDTLDFLQKSKKKALSFFWQLLCRTKPSPDYLSIAQKYLDVHKIEGIDVNDLAQNIELGFDKNILPKEIKLEDVYRYAFDYYDKKTLLADKITQYPNLLGIKNLDEAKARVYKIYREINLKLNISSKLAEFNTTHNQHGDKVWVIYSGILAEFLFNKYPEKLTQQDFFAVDKNFDTELKQVLINLMTKSTSDFAQDTPERQMLLDFQNFINDKREANRANDFGLDRKASLKIAEDFILEQNNEDLFEKVPQELADCLFTQTCHTNEELNQAFYQYIISTKPDLEESIISSFLCKPEIINDEQDQREILINKINPNFSSDIRNLFRTRKKNLEEELHKFFLKRQTGFLSQAEIDQANSDLADLNSDLSREFLVSVFGRLSSDIYDALKTLEFKNDEERYGYLNESFKRQVTNNGEIDLYKFNIDKHLKRIKKTINEVLQDFDLMDTEKTKIASKKTLKLSSENYLQNFFSDLQFEQIKKHRIMQKLLEDNFPNQEKQINYVAFDFEKPNNPDSLWQTLVFKFSKSFALTIQRSNSDNEENFDWMKKPKTDLFKNKQAFEMMRTNFDLYILANYSPEEQIEIEKRLIKFEAQLLCQVKPLKLTVQKLLGKKTIGDTVFNANNDDFVQTYKNKFGDARPLAKGTVIYGIGYDLQITENLKTMDEAFERFFSNLLSDTPESKETLQFLISRTATSLQNSLRST
jgi:hypothetical protein